MSRFADRAGPSLLISSPDKWRCLPNCFPSSAATTPASTAAPTVAPPIGARNASDDASDHSARRSSCGRASHSTGDAKGERGDRRRLTLIRAADVHGAMALRDPLQRDFLRPRKRRRRCLEDERRVGGRIILLRPLDQLESLRDQVAARVWRGDDGHLEALRQPDGIGKRHPTVVQRGKHRLLLRGVEDVRGRAGLRRVHLIADALRGASSRPVLLAGRERLARFFRRAASKRITLPGEPKPVFSGPPNFA